MDADSQDSLQTIPENSLLERDLFYINFKIKKSLGLNHIAINADAEVFVQKMDVKSIHEQKDDDCNQLDEDYFRVIEEYDNENQGVDAVREDDTSSDGSDE